MRKAFNWSLLDRDVLQSMLYRAKTDVVGNELTPAQFQKIVSKQIKAHLPIKVTSRRGGHKQNPGYVYIGGLYYSDYDAENRKQIEIIFSYHPDEKTITISNHKWKKMCSLFADTVLHEIIHMKQYRARKFKTIVGYTSVAQLAKQQIDQSYYGHKDEIGAFSFNIACELHRRFKGDVDKISKYINSNTSKKHKSSTYAKYLLAFNWDHSHKVVRELKRRVLQQLPNAANGKPFTTPNYINY